VLAVVVVLPRLRAGGPHRRRVRTGIPVTVVRPLRTMVTGGLEEEAGISLPEAGERAGADMVTP